MQAPLCHRGPTEASGSGGEWRLGILGLGIPTSSLPWRTVSFYVSLEISSPRGLCLEGLETSLTLGAQQGPLQKCPAIRARVQEHAEESPLSSDVHGGDRADCGREGSRDFLYKAPATSSTTIPMTTQQRRQRCPKFTNGKTESQKELEASVQQPAMIETNYRGTSPAASVRIS